MVGSKVILLFFCLFCNLSYYVIGKSSTLYFLQMKILLADHYLTQFTANSYYFFPQKETFLEIGNELYISSTRK